MQASWFPAPTYNSFPTPYLSKPSVAVADVFVSHPRTRTLQAAPKAMTTAAMPSLKDVPTKFAAAALAVTIAVGAPMVAPDEARPLQTT